jgi:hypothetical protein
MKLKCEGKRNVKRKEKRDMKLKIKYEGKI